MCSKKDYFETLELIEGGDVHLGDRKACKFQGMSSVHLMMFDNSEFLLHDVRYVPELKRNLLSISMHDNLGYETRIDHGIIEISLDAKIIGRGTKVYGLYLLDGSTIIGHAFIASRISHDVDLWDFGMILVSDMSLVGLVKQGLLGNGILKGIEVRIVAYTPQQIALAE
ncbi:putative Ty-1 copia retrotransposon protein [Trifolium medium]|uniref:Putative Ty-1 copia retrotransposon protein n=1 Tax=Trifolium medium TaxID=97028 RepID=A0A392M548_9FABA|nr:putative Ty-1 copia retrotransposon protein [Trifolium medium]